MSIRIISKFKDYYDGVQYAGEYDPEAKVWIRNTEVEWINTKVANKRKEKTAFISYMKYNADRYTKERDKYRNAHLIIGTKDYPLKLKFETESTAIDKGCVSCPNLIHALTENTTWYKDCTIKTIFTQNDWDVISAAEQAVKSSWSRWWREDNKVLPEAYSENECIGYCLKYSTPVVLIVAELIIKNPSLLELNFPRIVDLYTVYQNIDMCLNNILVADKMEIYPRTDIEILESKGFDKKTSFRNVK